MSAGRKTKKNIILENLDRIKEWKKIGATDEQIYRQLGIGKTAWYKHIKEDSEIANAIKMGVESFVIDLRGELARQAFKHKLETKKQYIKVDEETGHKTQYTEITTKEVDGNLGALHLLLKNLDRDNWKNDWDIYDFKKQELELRKKIADDKLF